ncbi:MAG: DUF4329 domain-containing protein [Burkholderiaceae bacterium]|nr:DUF4329 domain-containing protein [Burkholderiaceae bacterium]
MPQQDRGFESAEAAFSATFIRSGIGQRGYDENREYAAALYQMPDGSWYATPVVAGGRDRCSIPYHLVPPEAVRIAGAHTHGRPELPGDSTHAYGTNFSQTDRRNAMQAYVASHGVIDTQLLLTSRLAVLRMSVGPHYDPNGSRIALACETQALSVDYSERAAAP